jgi:hypothetical protein
VLFCVLGVLMFLGVSVAATALETASSRVVLNVDVSGADNVRLANRTPVLIDCTGDTARVLGTDRVIIRQREQEALRRRRWGGTAFTDFLADVSREQREYVVFLVRPKGKATFETLRAIVEVRNRELARRSVAIREVPSGPNTRLQRSLLARAGYSNGQLSYTGVMTERHRDLLRSLFRQPTSRQAVDALYERSRAVTEWIDHGVELVPAGWQVEKSAQTLATRQHSASRED